MNSSDTGNARIAIVILGLVALTCLVGGIVLSLDDKALPDAFIAIGSSAATAVGFVITRPIGGTQQVEVVNATADPVPVEPQAVKAATKKRTPKP